MQIRLSVIYKTILLNECFYFHKLLYQHSYIGDSNSKLLGNLAKIFESFLSGVKNFLGIFHAQKKSIKNRKELIKVLKRLIVNGRWDKNQYR